MARRWERMDCPRACGLFDGGACGEVGVGWSGLIGVGEDGRDDGGMRDGGAGKRPCGGTRLTGPPTDKNGSNWMTPKRCSTALPTPSRPGASALGGCIGGWRASARGAEGRERGADARERSGPNGKRGNPGSSIRVSPVIEGPPLPRDSCDSHRQRGGPASRPARQTSSELVSARFR